MNAPSSVAPLYASASRAVLLGLAVNLALGATKLIGGILGNSFALISDAVNSIGDSFSSLVVLFGLYVAQQPADTEHPYGHTARRSGRQSERRAVDCVLRRVGGVEAVARLGENLGVPSAWTLWIAGPTC